MDKKLVFALLTQAMGDPPKVQRYEVDLSSFVDEECAEVRDLYTAEYFPKRTEANAGAYRFTLVDLTQGLSPAIAGPVRREIQALFRQEVVGKINTYPEVAVMHRAFALIDVARVRHFLARSNDRGAWQHVSTGTLAALARLAKQFEHPITDSLGDTRCDGLPSREDLRHALPPIDLTPLTQQPTLVARIAKMPFSGKQPVLSVLLPALMNGDYPLADPTQRVTLMTAMIQHADVMELDPRIMQTILEIADKEEGAVRDFLYGDDPTTGTVRPELGRYLRAHLEGALRHDLVKRSALQGHPEALGIVEELLDTRGKDLWDVKGKQSPYNRFLYSTNLEGHINELLLALAGANGLGRKIKAIEAMVPGCDSWDECAWNSEETAPNLPPKVQEERIAAAWEQLRRDVSDIEPLVTAAHPDRQEEVRTFQPWFRRRLERLLFEEPSLYGAWLVVQFITKEEGSDALGLITVLDQIRRARDPLRYEEPGFAQLSSAVNAEGYMAWHRETSARKNDTSNYLVNAADRLAEEAGMLKVLDGFVERINADVPSVSYALARSFAVYHIMAYRDTGSQHDLTMPGIAGDESHPRKEYRYYERIAAIVDHELTTETFVHMIERGLALRAANAPKEYGYTEDPDGVAKVVGRYLTEFFPQRTIRNMYRVMLGTINLRAALVGDPAAETLGHLDANDRYADGVDPKPLRILTDMVLAAHPSQEAAWHVINGNADAAVPPSSGTHERLADYVAMIIKIASHVTEHTVDAVEKLVGWATPELTSLDLAAMDLFYHTDARGVELLGQLAQTGHAQAVELLFAHYPADHQRVLPQLQDYLKTDGLPGYQRILDLARRDALEQPQDAPRYIAGLQLIQTAIEAHRAGAWKALGDVALQEVDSASGAVYQLLDPVSNAEDQDDERRTAIRPVDSALANIIDDLYSDDLPDHPWLASYVESLRETELPAVSEAVAAWDELLEYPRWLASEEGVFLDTIAGGMPTDPATVAQPLGPTTYGGEPVQQTIDPMMGQWLDVAADPDRTVRERMEAIRQLQAEQGPLELVKSLEYLIDLVLQEAQLKAQPELVRHLLHVLIQLASVVPTARQSLDVVIFEARQQVLFDPLAALFALGILTEIAIASQGQEGAAMAALEEVAEDTHWLHAIAQATLCAIGTQFASGDQYDRYCTATGK